MANLEATLHRVRYDFQPEGSEEVWTVLQLDLTEGLSRPYEAVVHVSCENPDLDAAAELLGKNAELFIERSDEHNRRVCGIIRRVADHGRRLHERAELVVHIVPAFELLGHGRDTRVHQEKTAVEIVEETLSLALGPYDREVDASGLVGAYAKREMCVQYRESHRDFVSRLLEEEGIGYYFDFSGEGHERLVLFDATSQLADLETPDGNPVPFQGDARVLGQVEPVISFEAAQRLTATSVTVRDLDWTDAEYRAEATRDGEDLRGRSRARYDHGHGQGVTLYDFSPGGRYGRNDADFQARIRGDLAVRDQTIFTGLSLLTGLCPGLVFELDGHPVPGIDGRFVITTMRHRSTPPPDGQGGDARDIEYHNYHNAFECIPADVTRYVPDRDTPKPAIYGVQTAVVSGPNPGEPYTDEYGRIKVRFHWDREAIDPSRTSAWVRLGQTWAGHDGSGLHTFLFVPRVGSEVIVTFLDGDPDRPLVTGAVYNAQNLPPLALPDEATRSVLRTESIGGGGGHNELSFEDEAGAEEVYLRAERNLRELVQHDHATRVLNDQENVVDKNQTEEIGEDQELTVSQNRKKTVEGNETNAIEGTRQTTVGESGGDDVLTVKNGRYVSVEGKRDLKIDGTDSVHVKGARDVTLDSGLTTTVTGGIEQTINSGGWTLTTTGSVVHGLSGAYSVDAGQSVNIAAGSVMQLDATGPLNVKAQTVTIRSNTAVNVRAPSGIQHVTPAKEESVVQQLAKMTNSSASFAAAKLDVVGLATGVTHTKMEYTRLTVGLGRFTVGNEDIKAVAGKIEIDQRAAAKIEKVGAFLIG